MTSRSRPAATRRKRRRTERLVLRERTVHIALLAHVPLALIMFQVEAAATLHALATLGIGLWWAVNRRLVLVAGVGAYITGAEVLWRMTEANVVWEYGKYATVLLFVVALVRARRFAKVPFLPLIYFFLLIPSILVVVDAGSLGEVRRMISFNLSGPLALFVAAWFFYRLPPLNIAALRLLLLAVAVPIIGILTNAVFNTLSYENIQFSVASSVVTSGGYGPNQVSAVLGLGSFVLYLYLIISRKASLLHRLLIAGCLAALVLQAGLTFSRGGLAIAFGAAVAATFFLVGSRKRMAAVAVLSVLVFLFVQFVMIPTLNDFTDGAFIERYTDTSTTGRGDILQADLAIWTNNPVLGVGPGGANEARVRYTGDAAAAHTEFSRLFAEHGILGFGALIILLFMGAYMFFRARSHLFRALVAGVFTWAMLFMAVNAFRLVAPALLIGLIYVTYMHGSSNRST